MKPPYFIELALEGLIRDVKQRDALLGDLAEEWTARRAASGAFAANCWYAWQGARNVPHLLGDARRQTGWTATLAGAALVMVIRLATVLLSIFTGIVLVIPLAHVGVDPAINSVIWAVGSLWAFAGGMLAARWCPRAPIPAAMGLAVLAMITTVSITDVVTNGLVYRWHLAGDKLVSPPAALAGALYVLHRRRRSTTSTNPLPAHG